MFIPLACVFAQSIWQLTPPSQPKKNMHTAPTSRVTFLQGAVRNGVSLSHGSEYARLFPLLAEFRNVSTVSMRRQYELPKFVVCALMIAADGTVPYTCSYAAWMKLLTLLPKFTSTGLLAATGNVTSARVDNVTLGSQVQAAKPRCARNTIETKSRPRDIALKWNIIFQSAKKTGTFVRMI